MFSKPRSLLHCLEEDGDIDPEKFIKYQCHWRQKQKARMTELTDDSTMEEKRTKSLPSTGKRSSLLSYYDSDGDICELPPDKLLWFWLPYANFLELIEDARKGGWFPPWSNKHINRKKTSPFELMILGSLCYIGRGWTFDGLEEATGISQETHCSFFHIFIGIGSMYYQLQYFSESM